MICALVSFYQRSMDLQTLTTPHAGLWWPGWPSAHTRDELRTAVRVSAVVQGIDADKDILSAQWSRPAESERKGRSCSRAGT